ncbi:lipid-A-disaccharide synthase [Alteromonadaceae bacterium BrNp21-10]|nr:lipid-A-disaccharide synthase [Alteromonadaceae bacterium BrNp21-10]
MRIGMVVGEISGDILGSGVVKALQQRYPTAVFEGIGGEKMQALGFNSLYDMEELSVMGLFEVLSRLRRLLRIRKELAEHFIANPPDVFIGVDAPDFNLGLEKRLKDAGIKTVQYVSPTIWAWRPKRIFGIAAATNLVLSIFPFEKRFYDQYKVPCDYVGHTLADEMPLVPDRETARQQLNIDADATVIAVLPGSRGNEVKLLLAPFIQAAEIMAQQIANLQIVIPVANGRRKLQIQQWLDANSTSVSIRLVDGQSKQVMTASNAILLASGTATLEAMLCKRPMLVAYRFSRLSAIFLRRMFKAKFFSLPNLLADKALVPELLQEQVTPENIASTLLPLLRNTDLAMLEEFSALHQQLKCQADQQAAVAISKLIEETHC